MNHRSPHASPAELVSGTRSLVSSPRVIHGSFRSHMVALSTFTGGSHRACWWPRGDWFDLSFRQKKQDLKWQQDSECQTPRASVQGAERTWERSVAQLRAESPRTKHRDQQPEAHLILGQRLPQPEGFFIGILFRAGARSPVGFPLHCWWRWCGSGWKAQRHEVHSSLWGLSCFREFHDSREWMAPSLLYSKWAQMRRSMNDEWVSCQHGLSAHSWMSTSDELTLVSKYKIYRACRGMWCLGLYS